MVTMWSNGVYGEADRGHFESNLIRGNMVIAYTNDDHVELTGEYRASDKEAVEEFAAQYDIPVMW